MKRYYPQIVIAVILLGFISGIGVPVGAHEIVIPTVDYGLVGPIVPRLASGSSGGLPVPVLMYHHVGQAPADANSTRRDLTVSPADFQQQMAWLAEHHYHSITLAQLYLATQAKFKLPENPFVVTFDDGYADVFINAVPLLQRYNFIGSFGIITQFPGLPDYATWDQIKQASDQGMEIVSHTQTHFDGTNSKYNYDFIKQELAGSRADLRDRVGVDTQILIYPYGHYTADYIKTAQEQGFVMGLTVNFGKNVDTEELMHLPRVRVHGNEALERFIEIMVK